MQGSGNWPLTRSICNPRRSGSLFQHLHERRCRQLLADAQFLAVPTAQINRLTLLDRLEHYLDAALNILNIEALFVPGLGEVMMVVLRRK